ncbi:MAG: hypothetical protein K8R87_08030, partial [Verrucomicrobia bacterium]|nr:hypothetical protein [Verrucomicrobiota bacterium]
NEYAQFGLIVFALLCQLGCSIWLAISMARKVRKGRGHVALLSIVFVIASVIVGCVSFFAACISVGFHGDSP